MVQIANPSVRAMFANQMQLDAQVAKEQQEYLDALNRQEVAQDELETTKEQYKRLYEGMKVYYMNIVKTSFEKKLFFLHRQVS